MHVINATNVNDAYRKGLALILRDGQHSSSRNGPVLRMDLPVSTVYTHSRERVLLDKTRHANPFFHLFESLWMLNGQNDVDTMAGFLGSFKQFSDDGVTFHGAYGHRWRHWPLSPAHQKESFDQITTAINMLKQDPTSRRVVISMWDPSRDLDANSKDIPCNDMIKLWISQGKLHMVVFNRSNDIVWGCYGANAVHMSVLHEYLAAMTSTEMGTLTQISCDFHAYLQTPYDLYTFVPSNFGGVNPNHWRNPYGSGRISVRALVDDRTMFDAELKVIMDGIRQHRSLAMFDRGNWHNMFFGDVVIPMHLAWECIVQKNYLAAREILEHNQVKYVGLNDWNTAGIDWIEETIWRKAQKV